MCLVVTECFSRYGGAAGGAALKVLLLFTDGIAVAGKSSRSDPSVAGLPSFNLTG